MRYLIAIVAIALIALSGFGFLAVIGAGIRSAGDSFGIAGMAAAAAAVCIMAWCFALLVDKRRQRRPKSEDERDGLPPSHWIDSDQ